MNATSTAPDLATRCYLHIRQGIIERRFLPGETLSPAEIATEVGVSRTPVADALQRLEMEGLVEIHPRRGTVVTRVTTRGVQEVAEARTMIELFTAPAAVANATPEARARLRALLEDLEEVFQRDDARLTYPDWYRVNGEFHRYLVSLGGNEHILKMYDALNLDVRLMRVVAGWGLTPLRPKLALSHAYHRKIVDAFERGAVPELQDLMRAHIVDGTERALATLELVGGTL